VFPPERDRSIQAIKKKVEESKTMKSFKKFSGIGMIKKATIPGKEMVA